MESIQSLLNKISQTGHLKFPLQNAILKKEWHTIVGEYIANKTTRVSIYEKKLFIKIPDSVIRNEILLTKNVILEKVNTKFQTHVQEIVIQ